MTMNRFYQMLNSSESSCNTGWAYLVRLTQVRRADLNLDDEWVYWNSW